MTETVTPRWRAVVDNDFGGDPDGLLSLYYLSALPEIVIDLVTTTACDAELTRVCGFEGIDMARRGADFATQLLGRLPSRTPEIRSGAPTFDHDDVDTSDAVRGLIDQAEREHELPLLVLCGGPLTNVAAAARLSTALRERAALIWIGGDQVDATDEYNEATDVEACRNTRTLLRNVLRIPRQVYSQLGVPVEEVTTTFASMSEASSFVAERLADLPPFVPIDQTFGAGDCGLPFAIASGLDRALLGDGLPGWTDVAAMDTAELWADLQARRPS